LLGVKRGPDPAEVGADEDAPPTNKQRQEVEEEKGMALLTFVRGDTKLAEEILEMGRCEDDPPVLFEWVSATVEIWRSHFNTARAAPANAANFVVFGAAPAPADADAFIDLLMLWLSQQSVPAAVVQSRFMISCSLQQYHLVICAIALLNSGAHPWVQDMIAAAAGAGVPVTPLALLKTLRTGNSKAATNGTVDALLLPAAHQRLFWY
jgi:hypothetical protein